MPSFLDRVAARLAFLHANSVYGRFLRALDVVQVEQERVVRRVLPLVADSDFGRRYDLRLVRSVADLRRAMPLMTYEDYRPYVDRVAAGESGAMFSPGQQVVMFATSSGTTAQPKRVPVTPSFVKDYRRGWNTFGLKMLVDHPRAVLRAILQASGRYDSERTSAGIPCGAITGLIAATQKSIVRRFYVSRPEVGHLTDSRARYYALMRLGVVRDVAFAITANPSTLIQMARTADESSETLIRDVRDGSLASDLVPDATLRAAIAAGLKPQPGRAAELERLRATTGHLRPRDFWHLEFLACWTGGSMGHYLGRLADWWGPVPVRDVGLLASEGRVSVPLEDGTAAGVLDVTGAAFEFIPVEQAEKPTPDTLLPHELEVGQDYIVVLTASSGLLRYRLDDVVAVRGWVRGAPLVEFLYRSGRVASVAGEKLTENQAVAAVRAACRRLGVAEFDFVLAPCWGEPPRYRLSCSPPAVGGLAEAVDAALAEQNEEYASRRKSARLGLVTIREVPRDAIATMDRRLAEARRSATEQYKRPCLFTDPGGDDTALGLGGAGVA